MSVTISGDSKYSWCVYVLECEWANASNMYDDAWVHAAADADKRVYVGSTNNLERRMNEHLERLPANHDYHTSDGAYFTQKFEPNKLIEVEYCKTEREARKREEELASELKSENPYWFVFQA